MSASNPEVVVDHTSDSSSPKELHLWSRALLGATTFPWSIRVIGTLLRRSRVLSEGPIRFPQTPHDHGRLRSSLVAAALVYLALTQAWLYVEPSVAEEHDRPVTQSIATPEPGCPGPPLEIEPKLAKALSVSPHLVSQRSCFFLRHMRTVQCGKWWNKMQGEEHSSWKMKDNTNLIWPHPFTEWGAWWFMSDVLHAYEWKRGPITSYAAFSVSVQPWPSPEGFDTSSTGRFLRHQWHPAGKTQDANSKKKKLLTAITCSSSGASVSECTISLYQACVEKTSGREGQLQVMFSPQYQIQGWPHSISNISQVELRLQIRLLSQCIDTLIFRRWLDAGRTRCYIVTAFPWWRLAGRTQSSNPSSHACNHARLVQRLRPLQLWSILFEKKKLKILHLNKPLFAALMNSHSEQCQ